MSFSNYAEAAVLGHIYGSTTLVKPSNIYIALFSTTPGEAGGGVEISGGAYVRKVATWSVTGFAPTIASLAALTEWPAATTDWGTIMGVATFDAATGGNVINYTALAAPKNILSGDVFRLAVGAVTISLD